MGHSLMNRFGKRTRGLTMSTTLIAGNSSTTKAPIVTLRQAEVLELLQDIGTSTVEYLGDHYGVSRAMLRKLYDADCIAWKDPKEVVPVNPNSTRVGHTPSTGNGAVYITWTGRRKLRQSRIRRGR